MSEQNRTEVSEALSACDVIFAQRIRDDYPIDFVRTSVLKQSYPNVVSWPNIYFSGYFPDIEYIYLEGIGKLVGPLDDYHPMIIYNSFIEGHTVEACLSRYMPEAFFTAYPDPIESSLQKLRDRESETDLAISDFIYDNLSTRKLFYTVNHPSNYVLFEMARRMLATGGAAFQTRSYHPYALSRINIPVYAPVRVGYGLATVPGGSFVGLSRLDNRAPANQATTKVFEDIRDLVESFYVFYSSVPQIAEAVQ